MSEHCNNCGLCCQHMRTPPFCGPDDPRWQALPDGLKRQIDSWLDSPRMKLSEAAGDDFPCLWLNLATGQCRHYDYRPDVCREYEPGNVGCRNLRLSVGLTVKGLPVVVEED